MRDNGTTLEATVSGHLNLTPIPVTRAAFPRYASPPLPSIQTSRPSFKSLIFHHYSTLFHSSPQAFSRSVFRGEAKPPRHVSTPLNPNKATPTIPVDKFVYTARVRRALPFSPPIYGRARTPPYLLVARPHHLPSAPNCRDPRVIRLREIYILPLADHVR